MVISALFSSCLFGQVASDAEVASRANYAFAAYMGNGLYTSTSADLYVINAPVTFDREDGLKLRLTTSVGFFDYSPTDLAALSVPDDIGTLTVLPGVEKSYSMSESWQLTPHVDVGYARNFSASNGAWLYATGVESRTFTGQGPDDDVWVNKLLLAGYQAPGESDLFTQFMTGYDYRLDRSFSLAGRSVASTVYGRLLWQGNGLEKLQSLRTASTRELQYEAGVSFVLSRPLDLGLFGVSRVGMGFQKDAFGTTVRFFVGAPF